ncbi:4-hydroxy-tetrahydrodipicolinate synthase [Oscillospiraceae bacterium OttesenSCG-928-F05]|nr:4-hydroxy-tetrahydrodipicolinate synthase [Oscillospiraceae bacterium OttesenSCG-928-F05]
MKTPVFEGAGVAIVTPFSGDGSIDFPAFRKLIDFQINGGTDAIIVCGTTGEASTQTTEEHMRTVAECVKHVAGRVPVIAGTGSNDTAHALEMSEEAEKNGADALLLVTPYYNKTTQAGLIKHFTYIADRVNIPIILYNIPGRTGMAISIDAFVELSKHPKINGVKESTGDIAATAEMMRRCGDNMNVWSGDDNLIVPLMSIGAKGVISVLANIMPAETAKICHDFLDGNTAAAGKAQVSAMEIINALFVEVNPIPVKTALNLMGMDAGMLRMPLCEMSPKNLETLRKAMQNAGLSV